MRDVASQPNMNSALPLRERRYASLREAASYLGVSPASLYRFEHEGKIGFKRLAGRTLVEVADLIALADTASDWTPSGRGEAAVARRVALAQEDRERC